MAAAPVAVTAFRSALAPAVTVMSAPDRAPVAVAMPSVAISFTLPVAVTASTVALVFAVMLAVPAVMVFAAVTLPALDVSVTASPLMVSAKVAFPKAMASMEVALEVPSVFASAPLTPSVPFAAFRYMVGALMAPDAIGPLVASRMTDAVWASNVVSVVAVRAPV